MLTKGRWLSGVFGNSTTFIMLKNFDNGMDLYLKTIPDYSIKLTAKVENIGSKLKTA